MLKKTISITIFLMVSLATIIFLSPAAVTGEQEAAEQTFLPMITNLKSLTPFLVKDINTRTPSSHIYCPVFVGNHMLCSATDEEHGYELWKSNGQAGGAALLKDIKPGLNDSYALAVGRFPKLNNKVLFHVDADNADLWLSDGTKAGTILVKGGFWDMGSEEPFTVAGDLVYFMANDGDHGFELWRSDGTGPGTYFLKEMYDGYYAGIRRLTALGDKLYFIAEGEDHDALWVTNGTSAGTQAVSAMSGVPVINIAPLDDFLIVDGYNTAVGHAALWRTDGTTPGTKLVSNYAAGDVGDIYEFATLDAKVIFTTYPDSSGSWGIGETDGSSEGTALVSIESQQDGYPYNLTAAGSQAFFFEERHAQEKNALWRSDGTAAGTKELAIFNPPDETFCPADFLVWDSTLYFIADDDVHGCELWRSDGTSGGTMMVADIVPGSKSSWPKPGVVFKSRLYFSATDASGDAELWRTDGSAGGTMRADNVIDFPSESSFPNHLIAQPQGVYLSARTGDEIGLWRSDGTESGSVLLKSFGSDSFANPLHSAGWAMAGGKLYLITETPGAVWRSNGTSAGTVQLSGPEECDMPYLLAPVGDKLFFFAQARGDWLCQAGDPTVKIKYIGDRVDSALAGGSLLYFRVSQKIGVSDGTPGGTKIFNSPVLTLGPNIATTDDAVYFNGCAAGSQDCELWRLQGLNGPPQLVIDIGPGLTSSNPRNLISAFGELLFEAELSPYGTLLWRSNGSAVGTLSIAQLDICADPQTGPFAAILDGRVYFPAHDNTNVSPSLYGCELWSSNGTFEGTRLVKDILFGPNHSIPSELIAAPGRIIFTADDGQHGRQIWASDGSGAGTIRVSGFNVQAAAVEVVSGEAPHQLTFSQGKVYTSGYSPALGQELWAFLP